MADFCKQDVYSIKLNVPLCARKDKIKLRLCRLKP